MLHLNKINETKRFSEEKTASFYFALMRRRSKCQVQGQMNQART